MGNFDHYFQNRTPTQLRFLTAVNESGTAIDTPEAKKHAELQEKIAVAMLQSGNSQLLEVMGAAAIIAQQCNTDLATILLDCQSPYEIVRYYHQGGNTGAINAIRDRETRLACSL